MSRRLVVVAPGMSGTIATWHSLVSRLRQEPALAGAEWVLWDHHRGWYSRAKAADLSRELRSTVDAAVASRGPFDDVMLLGHSLGGLLVRQAYLYALGADGNPPQQSAWARQVSRIVMFASLNRGADGIAEPEKHVAANLRLANWAFRVSPGMHRLLSYDVMRGSEFLTNLRLQWIREFDALGDDAPMVVQLLGQDDWLVKREDSIDVEQFRSAWHVDVPKATHADIHRLDKIDRATAEGRYALIRSAILDANPLSGENRPPQRKQETVVFILHGIRANNRTWATDLKKHIEAIAPDTTVIPPSYGYLSAAQFAIPMTRRRPLTWFQDQYSNVIARNPSAQVHFVGHSNGTYLLGHSLRAIPAMRFENVVLVGSVLPTDYDWNSRAIAGQVRRLQNHRANGDMPVSFLCSGLRGLRMRDIGPGGFEGFQVPIPRVTEEVFWYDGGHSAPLRAENLPTLARAVLGLPDATPTTTNRARKSYERFPRLAPWIFRVIAVVVLYFAVKWVGFAPHFSAARLLYVLIGAGALLLIADLI